MTPLKLPLAAVSTAAALAVGVAVGAAAVEPEVETVVETKTVTETVETTPDACLSLIDDGDALIELLIEASDISADGFQAIADGDLAGLDRATARTEALGDEAVAVIEKFYANVDGCDAEGGDDA